MTIQCDTCNSLFSHIVCVFKSPQNSYAVNQHICSFHLNKIRFGWSYSALSRFDHNNKFHFVLVSLQKLNCAAEYFETVDYLTGERLNVASLNSFSFPRKTMFRAFFCCENGKLDKIGIISSTSPMQSKKEETEEKKLQPNRNVELNFCSCRKKLP